MRYNRNNIKITFVDEPVFVIDEKDGTIYCTLKANLVTPTPVGDELPSNFAASVYGKQFMVKSKAKCSANDKYDVDRGKRIAMAKAENKIYAAASKYLANAEQAFDQMLNALKTFRTDSIKFRAHNIDYIDALTMKSHPNYFEDVRPTVHNKEVHVN